MSLVERNFAAIRHRLRYPKNAVQDHGIDLKRKFEPVPVKARFVLPYSVGETVPDYRLHYGEGIQTIHVVKVADIIDAVCKKYKVSKVEILSARKAAYVVFPRHVGMYLAKTITLRSYPFIAKAFGRGDHTTPIHAFRKIAQERLVNPKLDADLRELEALFASKNNPEGAPCNSPQTAA
jgi:hypothetical protein